MTTAAATGKARRGFAAMDPETRRRIAKMGGKAVPPEKRSFSQDRKLAAASGRRGGKNRHAKAKGLKPS